jgi:fucose 4-O-acetylase-like acetyltransferase
MDIFNAGSILKEKRYAWIDSDKGISIILVGYGHCLLTLQGRTDLSAYPIFTYIGLFLYGFRMPLFFIISGIFINSGLYRKKLSGYIENRTNIVFYPLLIWGFLQTSIFLITSKLDHLPIEPMLYLKLIIEPRAIGHFWYLNALFFISVIFAFLKAKVKIKPVVHLLLGLVLYCISAYFHIYNVRGGFMTDICEFYIFFALGDFISHIVLNEVYAKRFASFKIFIPLLAIFLFTQYNFAKINLHGGVDGINYVEHKMPVFFLFEALLGCTISMNFSFLLQKYNVLRFLRVIGFHSLFIYVMQILVMTFTLGVLSRVFKITYVPALIIIVWVSGVILPIFIYNLCIKMNFWWLFTFKKPRVETNHITVNKMVNLN